MHVLIGIALKSLLIAGMTLGILQLMKSRSAAERSWVAHIGLLALLIMALAPLVLPSWNIEAPAIFNDAGAATTVASAPAPLAVEKTVLPTGSLANPISAKAAPGTIRKVHAKSIGENSVHGSDAPETAVSEIAQFFAGNEIVG